LFVCCRQRLDVFGGQCLFLNFFDEKFFERQFFEREFFEWKFFQRQRRLDMGAVCRLWQRWGRGDCCFVNTHCRFRRWRRQAGGRVFSGDDVLTSFINLRRCGFLVRARLWQRAFFLEPIEHKDIGKGKE